MTGFGSHQAVADGREILVEVHSVNGRFLDVFVRLSPPSAALEESLRAVIRQKCERGRITASVTLRPTAPAVNGAVKFDRHRVETYLAIVDSIRRDYGRELPLSGAVRLEDLILPPDPLKGGDEAVAACLSKALDMLVGMQEREGAALATDLLARTAGLRSLVESAELSSRASQAGTIAKYVERLKSLMSDTGVDERRLVQEGAILADKSDVTEELVRLKNHLAQFDALIESGGAVGKQMGFLVQEMQREANTVASKSEDLGLVNLAMEMKGGIEKVREQVQNVL